MNDRDRLHLLSLAVLVTYGAARLLRPPRCPRCGGPTVVLDAGFGQQRRRECADFGCEVRGRRG
jgi:hypothetical protein